MRIPREFSEESQTKAGKYLEKLGTSKEYLNVGKTPIENLQKFTLERLKESESGLSLNPGEVPNFFKKIVREITKIDIARALGSTTGGISCRTLIGI